MEITFAGMQIKYQESLISSDDAGFAGKNYAIVIRRKLREEEATTSRFYCCSDWKASSSIALSLLEFCSTYALKALCAWWTMLNHSFLRTCSTKWQRKRESDEYRERPNMSMYAMPGREKDWKILSLTSTPLSEKYWNYKKLKKIWWIRGTKETRKEFAR